MSDLIRLTENNTAWCIQHEFLKYFLVNGQPRDHNSRETKEGPP